ncbi:hypothetical protein FHS96_005097 [Sphingomonas zeicaulis]
MLHAITIGLDIAKTVFHAHGADERCGMVFSRKLSRAKLLNFFAKQSASLVAREACSGAHHRARELRAMWYEVRLIPPAYVKPFVKRHKNDAVDAEAICEAGQRPGMQFVAVKSEEQQAAGMVVRTRDLVVRQRTQLVNALRGHLAEFGWVAPRGLAQVTMLADLLDEEEMESSLPEAALAMLRVMADMLAELRRPYRQPRQGDRQAGPRERGSAPADDHPRHRPDRCHRDRRARAAARDLYQGSRFRRLARARAAPALDGRQAEAWPDLEDGRTNHPAVAHHRRQLGRQAGDRARRAGRIMA